MHRRVEGLDLDDHGRQATQRDGERGNTQFGVARVAHDDQVGGDEVGVGRDPPLESRRPGLFFALDQHLDADAEVGAQRPQGGGVHDHAALVVGGAAAVQAAVAHNGSNGGVVHRLSSPAGCTS